jgi:hypothetical protein
MIALLISVALVGSAGASSVVFGWGGYAEFNVFGGAPNTVEMTFMGGTITSPSTDPLQYTARVEMDPIHLTVPDNSGSFAISSGPILDGFRLIDISSGNLLATGDVVLSGQTLDVNLGDTNAAINLAIDNNLFGMTLEPAGILALQNNGSNGLAQILANPTMAFNLTLPLAVQDLTQQITNGAGFGTSFAASLSFAPPIIEPPVIPVPGALSAGIALFAGLALTNRRRRIYQD